ncbi:MAG TPA: helix-turn-helix domain-containing protein [Steroidobacteraceae bacterium]|nr:helix-turn-helix domain-containing protein [Steroidobacteraceae bacterium]
MRPSKLRVTAAGHLPSGECPRISQVLARVGEKWSVLIIIMLTDGPHRFSELKRAIGGISQRMLTLSLRGLERDGLVKRTVFPVVPPRVEYELTALGRSLHAPVSALGEWARSHLAEIDGARAEFDRREASAADKPPYRQEHAGYSR